MTSSSKDALIVILSMQDDAHIPYVTKHLETPYVVLDPSKMIEGYELTYTTHKSGLRISYGDTHFMDRDILSVWYRKPDFYTADSIPVESKYRDYAHSAVKGHADISKGLFGNALWVSGYYEIKRASNKVRQLMVAYEVGLKTPDTIFTSSSRAAEAFIRKHPATIVKTLASVFAPNEKGETMFFFAKKVNAANRPSLSGLNVAPAIFQQAINAVLDIRVTVVAHKLFAASITGSDIDKEQVRDWRIAHFKGSISIVPHKLPDDIATKCKKLVKALGLKFGAIDLVLDKNGDYWFLENNPNGQWAFIEEATKQPIGKAIAGLLERNK